MDWFATKPNGEINTFYHVGVGMLLDLDVVRLRPDLSLSFAQIAPRSCGPCSAVHGSGFVNRKTGLRAGTRYCEHLRRCSTVTPFMQCQSVSRRPRSHWLILCELEHSLSEVRHLVYTLGPFLSIIQSLPVQPRLERCDDHKLCLHPLHVPGLQLHQRPLSGLHLRGCRL
jgi:hypothetical protein